MNTALCEQAIKKPNFFIVGAPKCATTSIAQRLSEHPQVYMSPIKEPHYFNTDTKYNSCRSLQEYQRLFAGVTSNHLAIGEASTGYLYSKVAVENIEKYSPGARYIVCLRNPIQMAVALHEEELSLGHETMAHEAN